MPNITISKTNGIIEINFGDSFKESGSLSKSVARLDYSKGSFPDVDLKRVALGADHVLVRLAYGTQEEWLLAYNEDLNKKHLKVDSVNNVNVSSLSDLYIKLKALQNNGDSGGLL